MRPHLNCVDVARSHLITTKLFTNSTLTLPHTPSPAYTLHITNASQRDESFLDGLFQLFGDTADDPGHYNLSPEWVGTQGGGYGRDAGKVVFNAHSKYNGLVEVTEHEASPVQGAAAPNQAWRVLRFNGVTRQSVARVSFCETTTQQKPTAASSSPNSILKVQANCLAQEYLKTMASVAAAILGFYNLLEKNTQQPPMRVLCIGVGGGSLPIFLAHHYSAYISHIDAVELDPVVVEAAQTAMGLSESELSSLETNLQVHVADGLEFVAQAAHESGGGQQLYDLVFLDAFDGQDKVPEALCDENFAQLLSKVLHPTHGTLLINFHSVGYDSINIRAKRFADILQGKCFSVKCLKQPNYTVVCSRGLSSTTPQPVLQQQLKAYAMQVADIVQYNFQAGSRAVNDLQCIS